MEPTPLPEKTLTELRREAHVSLSAVNTYLRCPEKYLYSYIAKTPRSHRTASLAFGASMHAALAAYYEHLRDTGGQAGTDMLLSAFSDRWEVELHDEIPVRFDEDESAGAMKDGGVALLSLFGRVPPPGRILHVELPFAVEVPDPCGDGCLDEKLVGAIDLVTQENGTPLVTEHKTTTRRFTEHRLAYDLQPTMYRYACRSLGLGQPDLRYQLFLRQRKPAIEVCPVSRTERDESEMIVTVAMVLRSIRAGIFFPRRDWHCDDCEYALRCKGNGGAA